MMNNEKTVSVFRMTPQIHELLKYMGIREERTMNNTIYFLIHKALKMHKSEDEDVNRRIAAYFEELNKKQTAQVPLVEVEINGSKIGLTGNPKTDINAVTDAVTKKIVKDIKNSQKTDDSGDFILEE